MKRGSLTIVMMTAGVVLLFAQSPRAFIRSLQGTVEIKAPGASDWQAAAAGQELEQDTLVSTGLRSTALISLGESTLTVRPLTRMSLRELQATTAAVRLDIELRTGRIRADIKAPEGRMVDFTVRSPIATASVRGTVFEFDTVNLRVNEGTVVFFGADNTAVYVAAGESSSPDPVSGKAAVPVETAAAQAPPPPAGVETIGVAPPAVSGPMSPVTPVNVTLSWGD